MLAQAALQNQTISFSTIMKLYSSASLIEKQRLVEKNENDLKAAQEQAQQQQLKAQQEQAQMMAKELETKQREEANIRDNETKVLVANITADGYVKAYNDDGIEDTYSEKDKAKLAEEIRQFDKKLALDKERLELERHKIEQDNSIKRAQLKKRTNNK